MSKRSEALEARNKVHMVLTAADSPVRSSELHTSPLLDGMPAKAIGAHLRQLVREGRARRNKAGTWSAVTKTKKAGVPVVPDEKPKMSFVLNTKNRTLELNVGGIRLPVEIEM